MRIDTEVLKRERPLADVVEASGILLRRGTRGLFWALCPFHQERTPSFAVDVRDERNAHFHCYGCGMHGDTIDFVMAREGCSFREACDYLARRTLPPTVHAVNVERERRRGPHWETLDPNSPQGRLVVLAGNVFSEGLWRSPHAIEYLRQRGVSLEVARQQQLGYADGRSLLACLRRKGPAPETGQTWLDIAADLGFLIARPATNSGPAVYHEFFYDRIVIPEVREGRPIWFIGRTLAETAVGAAPSPAGSTDQVSVARTKARAKYLSLPGERPILGLEHVVGQRTAYLVEGPFDLLAALGWSLPAFAICGTHVPVDRLPALGAAVAIYGVFDPDRAGQSAAERFAPLIGARWRPVRLPNGLDLAELSALGEAGRELFDSLVGRARGAAWREGRP
jgi:DNA primase